jgi:hypothetical protein
MGDVPKGERPFETKENSPGFPEPFLKSALSLSELFRQLRFLAVGGVLVYDALGGGLVHGACGGHESSLLVLGVIRHGGIQLLYRRLHRRFRHAVAQAVPFADEHSFFCGLDVRQSVHLLAGFESERVLFYHAAPGFASSSGNIFAKLFSFCGLRV